MTIVLLGENCKGIQNYINLNQKTKNRVYYTCSKIRKFRNNIAHNYYVLEVYDFLDILKDIQTILKIDILAFKKSW